MNDEPQREQEVPHPPDGMNESSPDRRSARSISNKKSQEVTGGSGRRSYRDKLCLLEALLGADGEIGTSELAQKLHDKYDVPHERAEETVKSYLDELGQRGARVRRTDGYVVADFGALRTRADYVDELVRRGHLTEKTDQSVASDFIAALKWGGTKIGTRLRDSEAMRRNIPLADKVVDLLAGGVSDRAASNDARETLPSNERTIQVIFIAAGSTLYSVCLAMQRRAEDLGRLGTIYTGSQIALDVLVAWQATFPGIRIVTFGGEIDRQTGSLRTEDNIGSISARIATLPLDAVVLSFNGLKKDGFWTDEREVNQLQALIRPSKKKEKLILIPMGWGKINRGEGCRVGNTELLKGGAPGTRHIIITDSPNGVLPNSGEEFEVLKPWIDKGVEIIAVRPAAEQRRPI